MSTFVAHRDAAVRALVADGLIGTEQPVVGLIDTAAVKAQVEALQNAFDAIPHTNHAVAAKAVTVVPLLRYLADLGMGCEVASPGEFAMAEAAGFDPATIVVDSPAKTLPEIEHALEVGAAMNIDNYQEMDRLDELVSAREAAGNPTDSAIGVRVNPVVGTGSIAAMSTATTTTKFGIAIIDDATRQELVDAIAARPWITQLHVHSGSQGVPLELAAEGIRRILALAEDVEQAVGRQQITRVDIGGGLTVNFDSDDVTPSYHDYASLLKIEVPDLFSGKYTVITEFGRSLLAKAGSIATKIEYTKDVGERRFAIGHAGAQVATRTVFMPDHWPLRVSAYTPEGTPSDAPVTTQDLAGPCCFTGDMIGRDYELPEFEKDGIAVIHDTGAYYWSTPFSYNALPRTAVYAYTVDEAGAVHWTRIRKQQILEELVAEAGEDVRL
ncbi:diaminopimelate decarboxylase [Brevibacterium litoralis]|uniref:diaminopimelate decarboxylase n=1 Tax=Brevibacterium litoralis TaxID=3138935 RepID=UPI0032EF862A